MCSPLPDDESAAINAGPPGCGCSLHTPTLGPQRFDGTLYGVQSVNDVAPHGLLGHLWIAIYDGLDQIAMKIRRQGWLSAHKVEQPIKNQHMIILDTGFQQG